MRRFLSSFAVLAALTTVFVAVAGAKPAVGSGLVSYMLTDDVTTNFLRGPVDHGAFLPQPDCPFAPAADSAHLVADVRGWEGAILDPVLGNRVVALHARVEGTVSDVAGSKYHLSGNFFQDGTTRFPLDTVPFDGAGRLTITGAAGIVIGDAAFRVVQDFPLEWDFWITRVDRCALR
jgi:hypothetical protein